LHSWNASIFVFEAEVAIKHEGGVALSKDEYALAASVPGRTYCINWCGDHDDGVLDIDPSGREGDE
jgi:hypothetical protein